MEPCKIETPVESRSEGQTSPPRQPERKRRFQLVKLDEPDEETTVTMLRGLRDRYEKAHNVVIRDEALQAAEVDLLRNHTGAGGTAAPYHWAAFQLVGDRGTRP